MILDGHSKPTTSGNESAFIWCSPLSQRILSGRQNFFVNLMVTYNFVSQKDSACSDVRPSTPDWEPGRQTRGTGMGKVRSAAIVPASAGREERTGGSEGAKCGETQGPGRAGGVGRPGSGSGDLLGLVVDMLETCTRETAALAGVLADATDEGRRLASLCSWLLALSAPCRAMTAVLRAISRTVGVVWRSCLRLLALDGGLCGDAGPARWRLIPAWVGSPGFP